MSLKNKSNDLNGVSVSDGGWFNNTLSFAFLSKKKFADFPQITFMMES